MSKRRRPFRSESVVDSRVHIDLDTMIESGIRGEKGLVDARTNVKGKMREKDAFPEKLRCQGTRCVGATTVVRRELNGGCIDVTFQFEGKGGRGKKRRWRRSKVRPAGSSPPLTEFYAIYTFESVADDDREHRIPILGALSAPIDGDH